MKVNPNMFRGYDLRGIAGEDLNPQIVEHIGRAYGTYMKRRGIPEAVVGRDSRQTSPEYSHALISGLNWAGTDVIDIGMNLVGTFYWSQYFLKRKGGAFVTASHNPAQYNGFKFAIDYSETLVSDGIKELLRMVENEDYEKGRARGKTVIQDIREPYFQDIVKRLPLNKKFRVVIDAGCATAGAIAPGLLRGAGCEVIESNCKLDPTFPLGAPDPTETHIAMRLSKKVLDVGADIGFSYDTDGDRIGIVDEKGTIIWNDVLVALFARDVLHDHPQATIMYNTLCSKAVQETILEHGGKPFIWRTGHSFLKKKNQEIGAAFIGELSGHFFFSKDFYNHDDGLYSTLRLLRHLAKTGQTLSEAVSSLPQYISSPEIKIFCSDDKKVALVKKLSPLLKKDYPHSDIIDDERAGDGVRLELPSSMFVIRYSQNGPYLTIKFESKARDIYNELKKYIFDLLHQFSEIGWESKINVNVESLF